MFENIVSEVLSRYFGKYISGLNAENLRVSLWAGDVTLENLFINLNAFDGLLVGIPLKVNYGKIGKMSLHFPWNKLDSQPVVVKISDVEIIFSTDYAVDPSIVSKQLQIEEQESKQRQLRNYEIISDKTTLTQRLITKVVNNMQIDITNVHLRYEGNNGWINIKYAFGITIDSIKLYSTTEDWEPTFVVENQRDHYKIAEIIKMKFYHSQTKEEKWENSVPKSYVMEDLTTKMHLTLSDKEDSYPITAQIILETLKVGVSQGVMIDIKSLMQQQKLFEGKCSQISRNINKPTDAVEKEPKKWWKFAFESMLVEVKKKNYKESEEYKRKRRGLRQEYTDIYTRVLRETTVKGDKERFTQLEEELSVKEIIHIRNFAKSEVDEAKRNNSGIWSWMGYSSDVNSQLSEDIHAFLGDDKDEKITDTKKLKQLDFYFQAKQFIFDLFGGDSNGAFVEVEVSDLECSVVKKTIGFTANLELNDAKVKSTKDEKHPHIFSSVKSDKNLLHIKLTSEKEEEKIDSDFLLDVQLEPTKIVYNKIMAEELMNLFKSLDVVESYGQIGVRLPSMNLKSVLDEHIRVVVSALIHTPYIIVPSEDHELHVDLGIVQVLTNERNGIYDSYKLTINGINCEMVSNNTSVVLLEKTQMIFNLQKALLSWKEMKEKLNQLSPGIIVDCLLDTTKIHISSEQMKVIRSMFKEQKPKPKTESEAIRDLLQQDDDSLDIGNDIIQVPDDFIKLKLTVSIPEASAFISLKEDEPIFNVSAKQLTMTSIIKDKQTTADVAFGDVIVIDNEGKTFFSKKQTNESLVSLRFNDEKDKPIVITLFAAQSLIYFDLPHLDNILHFIYNTPIEEITSITNQKKVKSKIIQVSFVFTSIGLIVANRGTNLASGSAVGGSFDISLDNNNSQIDITVKGSLKRIFAKDETLSGRIHQIVAQSVDTPINILYTHATTEAAIQKDFRHYLFVETDQLTATYLNMFIQQLYSWLQDLLHICSVRVFPSNQPSYSYDRLKIEANITNVSLCIPVASYIEEGIKLSAKQLEVKSTWIQNEQSTKSLILRDICFDENIATKEITFDFTFPDEKNQSVDFPAWDISLSIPSGGVNLTKERYHEIVGLIMINLGELSKHQDLIKYHPIVSVDVQQLSDLRNRTFTAIVGKVELNIAGEEEQYGIMKFEELKYKYLSLPKDCSLHTVEIKSGSFVDHLNKDQLLFWVEEQKKIDNFLNFSFETALKEKVITLSFGHSSNIRLTQETLIKLMKFFAVEKRYMVTESGFVDAVEIAKVQPERAFVFKFLMNEINFIMNDSQGDFMTISLFKSSVEMRQFKEDNKVSVMIGTLKAISDGKLIISTPDNKEMGNFEYTYEKQNELSLFDGKLSQIHIIFYDKVIIRGAQYYEQLVKILAALKGKTVQFIEKTASVSRKIRLNFVIEAPKIDIGEVSAQLGIVTITDKPGTLNKLEIIGKLCDTEMNIDKDVVLRCDGVIMEIAVIDADDGFTDVGIDVDCGIIDISTTPQNLTSLLNVADLVIKTSQQIQLPKL